MKKGDRRPGDLGQSRRRAAWRRQRVGPGRRTIPRRISTSSAPAIRRRRTPRQRAARATICIPARSSPSMSIPARWPGITRPRRTIPTIGIRRKTPILVDGEFNGKPRKMVLQASRNGYFFTLDRLTGEHLVTSKFGDSVNWAKGINARASRRAIPPRISTRVALWSRPRIKERPTGRRPLTAPTPGLFYVPHDTIATRCTISPRPIRAARWDWAAKKKWRSASWASYLSAIDYKTGKTVWQHTYPATGGGIGNGMLTTAGKLLFAGDVAGNMVAYDPANGKILACLSRAAFRTRPRPTCSTGTNTCWLPPAIRSIRSVLY